MSQVTAWYVSRNNEAGGPFATDMVLAMLRDGQLQPLDLVFREGEIEWKPAATYRELRSFRTDTTAAKSPSAPPVAPPFAPRTDIAPASGPLGRSATDSPDKFATDSLEKPTALSWIVLRPHSSTYLQEGPFESQTIIDGLQTGRFQFSQYAWHAGMSQWMRIGDLREFDRRARARENQPHVPPPLPDPIAAVLLEDDANSDAEEFHVVMRGQAKIDLTPNPLESMRALGVTQMGSIAFGGAAAESPESRPARDLARVPWEQTADQDISEGYAEAIELLEDDSPDDHAFTPTPSSATPSFSREPENLTPLPLPTSLQAPVLRKLEKDGWERWGRYVAGVSLAALAALFTQHLLTMASNGAAAPLKRKITAPAAVVATGKGPSAELAPPAAPLVDSSEAPAKANVTIAETAPAVAVAAVSPVSPVSPVAPPAPAATLPESNVTIVGMKLDRPDGQIVFQGRFQNDGGKASPLRVTFRGRLGQVLSKMSVRKTVALKTQNGEIPSLKLKDLKLPAGAYTVEVQSDIAGSNAEVAPKAIGEIFIGTRDGKFLDRLETHLREISVETQAQQKALFYSAAELDVLARDLGQSYGQLRAKPEQWNAFYTAWRKKLEPLRRSVADIAKLNSDDQAYPDETSALNAAVVGVVEIGEQYQQGIGQKRDIASDTLNDIITEIIKQKSSLGNASSRP